MPALLIAFGVVQLATGLGLWLVPDLFHDEVAPYGPLNEHYMGDLATFYLALGGAALVAARRPGWRVPVLALAGAQYALHTINHLVDVGEAEPGWLGPANLVAVGLGFALVVWMLRREATA